jgi:hypothetical protein
MDVGVKRPLDGVEAPLSPINNKSLKFHINLFPRTKESAEHERNYMLEVLKAMLSDDIYNITKEYILRCNYLKKEYVEMSKIEFNKIFQHFLSLDNRVYEVIIELGIFTPFHILVYDIAGRNIREIDFYDKIINKLGYDPIVLGGIESPHYLYSIAALIRDCGSGILMSDHMPILCDSRFKQNIKCIQILDNINTLTYSSPNYMFVVAWIDTDDNTPAGYENDCSRASESGVLMYKGYIFFPDFMPVDNYCSHSTLLHLFKLLMIILNEIDSKRDDESNAEYFKRLSNYNVELSRMFTVTNITYEIARYFMYNDNIDLAIYKPIHEIIYDNGRYIKHAKYITEMMYGLYGLYGSCRDMNIVNIVHSTNYNDNYKVMLLKACMYDNDKHTLICEAEDDEFDSSIINNIKASDTIKFINENYASNPSKYFWKIHFMLCKDFEKNIIDECFIHLNLDKKTKDELMHSLFISNGATYPNDFVTYDNIRFEECMDSEYHLYCYNIMRDTIRGFHGESHVELYKESYIKNFYLQGGPIKWQENMILYTQIEKGVGLFSTLVKDIRKLIVQYVLGKSFDEMSSAEKYYYVSIYKGERFIYDSAISMYC